MVIEVELKQLREDLINVYEWYLSEDKDLKSKSLETAKELDGPWSGSFLLPESIEAAVNSLTYLYICPYVTKERAENILKNLKILKI